LLRKRPKKVKGRTGSLAGSYSHSIKGDWFGGVHQSSGHGHGENWLNPGHTLKTELLELIDRPEILSDIERERTRRHKNMAASVRSMKSQVSVPWRTLIALCMWHILLVEFIQNSCMVLGHLSLEESSHRMVCSGAG
jgi:hypothetical protein